MLLLLTTAMYVVGYGSPFWSIVDGSLSSGIYMSTGLWMFCFRDDETFACSWEEFDTIFSSRRPGWWIAVRALQTIGLVVLAVGSFYCIIVNCCTSNRKHSRLLEIFGFFGGLFGFIACMIYVGNTYKVFSIYSWAFGLDFAGCLLALVASLVLWCSNSSEDAAGGVLSGAAYHSGSPQQGGSPLVTEREYVTDSYRVNQVYPQLYQQYNAPDVPAPSAPSGSQLYPPPQGYPHPPPQGYPPAYNSNGFQQPAFNGHSFPSAPPSYETAKQ